MTERAYTVDEIDQMRRAVEFRWLYGMKPSERPDGVDCLSSFSHQASDRIKAVDEQLRTYMLAGIAPEDLE